MESLETVDNFITTGLALGKQDPRYRISVQNGLNILLVVGTTIWVGIDASRLSRIEGAGSHIGGASSWVLGCLFLWIVFFPWYLVTRSAALREQGARPASAETAQAISYLVLVAPPAFGTVILPADDIVGDPEVDQVREKASEMLRQASLAKGLTAVAQEFADKVPDEEGRRFFVEAFVVGASLAHADHALHWGSAGAVDEVTAGRTYVPQDRSQRP